MSQNLIPLTREFYDRDCDLVARELLGKLLVRTESSQLKIARIVETEAYMGPQDLAAHSSKGRTARTDVLFGQAGLVYMYFIYGIYNMLNITTRDSGAAVLIRAIEPVSGIESKTSGPGLLTKALDLTRAQYGLDLTFGGELFVSDDGCHPEISTSTRIGVDYAGEWKLAPLRFFIPGNKYVSRR